MLWLTFLLLTLYYTVGIRAMIDQSVMHPGKKQLSYRFLLLCMRQFILSLNYGDAAIVAGIIMLCEADSMKRDSSKKRSELQYFIVVVKAAAVT